MLSATTKSVRFSLLKVRILRAQTTSPRCIPTKDESQTKFAVSSSQRATPSRSDKGRRIRDATHDPSGVPEVFKEFRLNDHRRHRGRQYLDYMVGATREKRSRPVSHRDFTGARYMRRATSVDHKHTRQFPIRNRRKNQQSPTPATSAQKTTTKVVT